MSKPIRGTRPAAKAFVGLVGGACLAVGASYQVGLRGSLPTLDGEQRLAGLQHPVVVERDALGVATIKADTREDRARALGYVHAQERFFQMDLARRRGAGELAELVGPAAIPLDKSARVHGFRRRAKDYLARVSDEERALLEAYASGVRAGLDGLGTRPFEYLVLRQDPRPWRAEDSFLVLASMFFQLNDETAEIDAQRGLLFETLPSELAEYLTPTGTEWDAPITGKPLTTRPVPGPELLDLRSVSKRVDPADNKYDHRTARLRLQQSEQANVGSNNWAVSGHRTGNGAALLASDMHLGHAVPNIWFRARMELSGNKDVGTKRWAIGVTLPGTPALVAGSNGKLAWGFTNSNGDWSDLVLLEVDDEDNPNSYRTPSGFREFERHNEIIHVRGEPSVSIEVLETIWGPVRDRDHLGRLRSIRWIAHELDALNLALFRLETAENVDDAMAIAPSIGIPPQNLVCVDSEGNIAWTIAGKMPNRFGFDGKRASSWADGTRGWNGWLPPNDYPRVVNPSDGILWTANARVIGGEGLEKIGDGGYALGARARQIREHLFSLESPTEADMLAVQLDDRALFLSSWRAFLLLELARLTDSNAQTAAGTQRKLTELRTLIESNWSGRASTESSGYRLVREARSRLRHLVLWSLTIPVREANPDFRVERLRQTEMAVWRILNVKPAHLVPPPHQNWDDAMAHSLAAMVDSLTEDGTALEERTWGQENLSSIRHPLSGALGPLSRWLDMPTSPLPGDSDMPRVQRASHGASQRLVVSPGKEAQGIFHMPGGQSGHPLAPYFGAGHEDWEQGRPTPLLPGETIYSLTLTPVNSNQ